MKPLRLLVDSSTGKLSQSSDAEAEKDSACALTKNNEMAVVEVMNEVGFRLTNILSKTKVGNAIHNY
jgi:hypothetical protein